MKKVFFMRHGKSDGYHLYEDDYVRPLIYRGRQEVTQAAIALATKYKIDAILASPAFRTNETARLVNHVFSLNPDKVYFDNALYNGSFGEYLEAIEKVNSHSILVVGHNPSIANLALHFSQSDGIFKTSEIIGVEYKEPQLGITSICTDIFSHLRH